MSRVVLDLSLLEAFQVVGAISNRLGYFEGTARDMLEARRARGDEKPDDYEAIVASTITQLRRIEKALDEAIAEKPHEPGCSCGIRDELPPPEPVVTVTTDGAAWLVDCREHGRMVALKDNRDDADLAAARHLANFHVGAAA